MRWRVGAGFGCLFWTSAPCVAECICTCVHGGRQEVKERKEREDAAQATWLQEDQPTRKNTGHEVKDAAFAKTLNAKDEKRLQAQKDQEEGDAACAADWQQKFQKEDAEKRARENAASDAASVEFMKTTTRRRSDRSRRQNRR